MRNEGSEASGTERDEILPEYDFSLARPNKYAVRYEPSDVEAALRAMAGKPRRARSRRSA
jgi:hypothetical protein